MNNKKLITEELTKAGYILGCYSNSMELLKEAQVKRVVKKALEIETGDITVFINKVKHILEVSTVDNEKDFNLITYTEYKNIYGNR